MESSLFLVKSSLLPPVSLHYRRHPPLTILKSPRSPSSLPGNVERGLCCKSQVTSHESRVTPTLPGVWRSRRFAWWRFMRLLLPDPEVSPCPDFRTVLYLWDRRLRKARRRTPDLEHWVTPHLAMNYHVWSLQLDSF